MGFVERRRSGEDERRVAVHLTPAGRSLSSKASAIPRHLADAAGLTAVELEQLRSTLERLTQALHRAH
jgi:DNA-binding MarR family transcriptional regulator